MEVTRKPAGLRANLGSLRATSQSKISSCAWMRSDEWRFSIASATFEETPRAVSADSKGAGCATGSLLLLPSRRPACDFSNTTCHSPARIFRNRSPSTSAPQEIALFKFDDRRAQLAFQIGRIVAAGQPHVFPRQFFHVELPAAPVEEPFVQKPIQAASPRRSSGLEELEIQSLEIAGLKAPKHHLIPNEAR